MKRTRSKARQLFSKRKPTCPIVRKLFSKRSEHITVQGDPDFETFRITISHFRKSTLSALDPSLMICLHTYIYVSTPPYLSPFYHTVLRTVRKSEIKTNDYSPLKKRLAMPNKQYLRTVQGENIITSDK